MHVEIFCFFINLTNIYLQLIMGAKLLLVCFVIILFWGKANLFFGLFLYDNICCVNTFIDL